MPLLRAEAEKLSREDIVRGVIEEIIDKDETFALLPWEMTKGKVYHYNRENTLSEADFLDPNDQVNEGAATFQDVYVKLKILVGDVDVDKFLASVDNDTNDQVSIQIQQKAKGLSRKFHRTMANGDSTVDTKSFDGLQRLVSSAQTIYAGTNGGALTLSLLDQLLDLVKNGADALIMRRGTIRAYRALLRASGGIQPAEVMMENFGKVMLTHNGVPILLNDYLPGNETVGSNTTTCSVYAIRMNTADGFHGLYGGEAAGVRFEDIGTVQTKDANRYRLKWYCATALKSTQSLARLAGITNI